MFLSSFLREHLLAKREDSEKSVLNPSSYSPG
jgi:hypothetical protein